MPRERRAGQGGVASARAPGCRPRGREPTLPAAALGGGLRCLPPRSAPARSAAPGTAASRPTEAFPAPSWGIPLPSRVPRKGSSPPRRRGSLLRSFAPPPLPPALCLRAPHPRGRALGVPFRDGVKHTGCSAGLPRLTPPAINFALTGDAVSPSSDRRGVCTPGQAPAGQMLDGSPAAVAPPGRGLAVPSALGPRVPVPARAALEVGPRRQGLGGARSGRGRLRGSSQAAAVNFFGRTKGRFAEGGPSVRGGGAPCLSPLTLHVFRHLPLFPIRPGESQGLRLHFGQHDKAAAGRAGGSVSVRDTSTWTRQHRFSWSKGRSAAAASSSSSSSLPLLHASPRPAAAGAPSGPGRREAPPGARSWGSRGAVVGLQAAGAERRRRKTGGCRGGRRNPGSPQQLRPGLSTAAARSPDPCGAAQCTGALCRRRCC